MLHTDTDYLCADQYSTLSELLSARVQRSPNAVAYRWYEPKFRSWQNLTWKALYRQVVQWRRRFLADGSLRPGDRIAMMLDNGPHWVVLEHAIMSAGLVAVPIHPRSSAAQVQHILRETGSRILFIDNSSHWTVVSARESQTLVDRVVCLSCLGQANSEVTFFTDWLAELDKFAYETVPPKAQEQDLSAILYTSGTTGLPKGVMHSHRGTLNNIEAVLGLLPVRSDDVVLSVQSMAESLERTIVIYVAIYAGATVTFARRGQELTDFFETGPTVVVAVPQFYERLMRRLIESRCLSEGTRRLLENEWVRTGCRANRLNRLFLKTRQSAIARKIRLEVGAGLRLLICGGAKLPQDVDGFYEYVKMPLHEGYGLTEAGPVVSLTAPGQYARGSVGQLLDNVQAKICEHGELWIQTSASMLGYWPDDFRDQHDWIRTGDRAELRDGRLYILGRASDELVLADGKKVNATLLEDMLLARTDYKYITLLGKGDSLCAVVAVPETKWEKYCADFQLDPEDPDALNVSKLRVAITTELNVVLSETVTNTRIQSVILTRENWHHDGLLTCNGKQKRAEIAARFSRALSQNTPA